MELDFGWRDLVMLAAALAGVYLIVAVIALARLRGRRPPKKPLEPTAADTLGPAFKPVPPGHAWDHPFLTPVRTKRDDRDDPPTLTEEEVVMEELAVAAETPPAPEPMPAQAQTLQQTPFAATLAATELETEMRQLRAEVASLRQELAEIKEARRISPLYADAAALAQRGFDARGVAEECGISVAEAELVLALSKEDGNFDDEVKNGPDGHGRDAGI